MKSLKKESYESSIDNRCSPRIADRGDDTEQHRSRVQSTAEFGRARSGQKIDGGKGILSEILRHAEKPVDKAPEAGRSICLVGDRFLHRRLHLALCRYREQDEPFESNCRAPNIGDRRRQADGSLGNSKRWEQCQISDQTASSR